VEHTERAEGEAGGMNQEIVDRLLVIVKELQAIDKRDDDVEAASMAAIILDCLLAIHDGELGRFAEHMTLWEERPKVN
jgi:hypothetical protein